MTYELGMPPVYKGRSGFEMGSYRPQNNQDLAGLFNLGVGKDLGSPVVGIAALRLEGYLGVIGKDFDGGGRALFEMPSFNFGVGVDYNGGDEVLDTILTFDFPVSRGGIFGRATTLAIRWLPSRDQTFTLGINVPLWGSNLGKTRPLRDNVRLDDHQPQRLELDLTDTQLDRSPSELRVRAGWLAKLTQPFAETKRTTEETYRLLRGREAAAQRIEQKIRNATFQVAASRLAIDLSRQSAEAARKNLDIVADNYTMGLVPLVDLLDAQTNALNAELATIDAVNDYLLDLMRVERAVGRFMFFVSAEEREAWVTELEAFAAERR